MTKAFCLRLPDDIQDRIAALRARITVKSGGIEPDFSKLVRHVLNVGLTVLEKEHEGVSHE